MDKEPGNSEKADSSTMPLHSFNIKLPGGLELAASGHRSIYLYLTLAICIFLLTLFFAVSNRTVFGVVFGGERVAANPAPSNVGSLPSETGLPSETSSPPLSPSTISGSEKSIARNDEGGVRNGNSDYNAPIVDAGDAIVTGGEASAQGGDARAEGGSVNIFPEPKPTPMICSDHRVDLSITSNTVGEAPITAKINVKCPLPTNENYVIIVELRDQGEQHDTLYYPKQVVSGNPGLHEIDISIDGSNPNSHRYIFVIRIEDAQHELYDKRDPNGSIPNSLPSGAEIVSDKLLHTRS